MSQIHALEQQLADAKEAALQLEDIEKLKQNRLFRKLILDGFCTMEAARYVRISIDTNMSAEDRADALGMAQAAGYFLRWLRAFEMMARNAAGDIPEIEEKLAELRAEEV